MDEKITLYDARSGQWLAFADPIEIVQATELADVPATLAHAEARSHAEGLYAVGFVLYEAAPAFDTALRVVPDLDGPPLCWFALFDKAVPTARPEPPGALPPIDWVPTVDQDAYTMALARIRQYIRAGDTYQVNYTLRLLSDRFEADPQAVFASMVHGQSDAYAAYLDMGRWVIASASPELFFTLDGDTLISRPMKGTITRGPTLELDRRNAAELVQSAKCRAENVMIVDMVRNDLGRIAEAGSVRVPRLFDAEKYPTVWQMTSTVACKTNAAIGDLFRALFPPASITGAPKVRTCEIIAELECSPRRIYTATVGVIRPDGSAQFNVAIRTLLVDRERQRAEYGIGGGIVWDSETDLEYEEAVAKAMVLTRPQPPFDLLETLLWDGSDFVLAADHLERLAQSAAYFNVPLDLALIRSSLDAVRRAHAGQMRRVRLVVDREGHARCESFPIEGNPVWSLPPIESGREDPPREDGARVVLARTPVDSGNRFLYHKTTHRVVYDAAKAEGPGGDDVILWNERGEVTETTIANIAVEVDGEWVTPPVSSGLLPGTLRAQLVLQGALREAVVKVSDLDGAQRLCLLNSVRGVRQAALIAPSYE